MAVPQGKSNFDPRPDSESVLSLGEGSMASLEVFVATRGSVVGFLCIFLEILQLVGSCIWGPECS